MFYKILLRILKKIKKNPQHAYSLLPELKNRIYKKIGFVAHPSNAEFKDRNSSFGLSFDAKITLDRINRLR